MVAFIGTTLARAVAAPLNSNYKKVRGLRSKLRWCLPLRCMMVHGTYAAGPCSAIRGDKMLHHTH